MNKFKILISLLIFISLNGLANSTNVQIKVKIKDQIITNIDIENEKNYLFFLNPNLKNLDKSRLNNIAMNSLINDLIKKNELKKIFDLSKENDFVDVIEKNLIKKKKLGDQQNLKEILKTKKINYENVREKFKLEALWNRLIYNKYYKNIKIDKISIREQITEEYKKKSKIFEYNISEIVVTNSKENQEEKKFNNIKKNINEIGFENTANIYSNSNTAKNGGLIGWVNELQLSNAIKEEIKKLKINQISKPINIQNGYLLIKLNDIKEFKQKINLEEEVKKLINEETNRQLNNFSIIFFKRLKMNTKINEY